MAAQVARIRKPINAGVEALQCNVSTGMGNIHTTDDLIYTTETDTLDQQIENSAQIDAEWQRRLRESGDR